MEGTIKIEAIPDMGVSLQMRVRDVSVFDMMGVFDALAEGFHMDKEMRRTFGLLFAFGGIDAMPGVKSAKVELDKEMFDLLKKMKENSDGSDS